MIITEFKEMDEYISEGTLTDPRMEEELGEWD